MENTSTFHVYNASAGSGKTFSLVKEYLKIVLKSGSPEQFKNILAITFTNKAANEMKERIVNNLRDFSKEEVLTNPTAMFVVILEEIGLEAAVVHKRSQRVLQQLLTQYGSFSVSTIDSFTHKLIRNFAFDLGLPINFEVELKSKNLLDLAVDKLIAQIGKDDELTNFLIEYALQNIDENKSWDFTEVIKSNVKVLLQESDRIHFQQTNNFDLQQFKELSTKLFKRKVAFENEFRRIGKEALQLITDNQIENDFSYHDLPNYYKKLIDFTTYHDSIKFEGRLHNNIQKGVLYAQKIAADKKAVIDALTPQLLEQYFNSKEYFETNYPNYVLTIMVLRNISAFAVLNYVNKELQQLKKEKSILLSAEFNQIISDEIKNQPAPFIYEKLGSKFRHFFIDEMQDTSELQWKNLIPLIENALSQEGSSLMLVGDAKQSIYRWRGGKTEQFIQLTSDNQSTESNPFFISKNIKNLDTNYRSLKTIVDFNNQFFSHIAQFLENEEHRHLFLNTVKQASKKNSEGGYVQIDFVKKEEEDEDNYQQYLRKIESIITGIDSAINKSDICILVRKNKQGVEVANYLLENGIQVVSSESLLLCNNEKVDFLVNLLKLVNQPLDNQVKFKVGYFLFHHLEIVGTVHDFISPLVQLSTSELFKKLKELSIDFKEDLFFQKPLYEAIEYLIAVFKLASVSDAYIQYFLDFVLEFQSKEINNLPAFLEEWDLQKENLSIIAPENKDAVRIMTVHKAKGLEFPIVIFPFDLEIRKEIKGETWIPSLPEEDFNGLPTMKVAATQQLQKIGEVGNQLYKQRQDELALDNFNLLYVAFTRAAMQLYIISEEKESKDIKYYSDLLKSYIKIQNSETESKNLYYEIGSSKMIVDSDLKMPRENQTDTMVQQSFINSSIENKRVNVVTNESKWWGTTAQEAKSYGNKIHQLLSTVYTEDDVEFVIKSAQNKGLLNKSEIENLQTLLLDIVNHPNLKPYFQHNLLVYNEREILTDLQEIIVPDRIAINSDKEATIIDYKTGVEKQEHVIQINNYAFYVEKMGYRVAAKLLVYINDFIEVKEVI